MYIHLYGLLNKQGVNFDAVRRGKMQINGSSKVNVACRNVLRSLLRSNRVLYQKCQAWVALTAVRDL